MRITILLYYLFIAVFLILISIFDVFSALTDPEMNYLKQIPVLERQHGILEFIYFKTNIACTILGLLLIYIGYKYYSDSDSLHWRIAYNAGFVMVTVITVLIMYVISMNESVG